MPYLPPFLRTSLKGWFRIDAFDESTVAAPVWRDLSGLGNDLVGAASVAYPGHFDGGTVYVGPDLSFFFGGSNATVLVAARPDDIVSSASLVTDRDCIWCSQTRCGGYLRDSAGVRSYASHNNDGSSDTATVTPANGLPDGEVAIFMWSHSGGANLFASVDDLLKDSQASGVTTSTGNPFRLGLNDAGTAGFTGRIFEVLIWSDTFTDEKLSQAINYLSGNWTRRGNPLGQARSRASRRLWEFRRPPALATLQAVPLDVLDVELLKDVTAIHPLGLRPGGAGWGEETYERGELRIMQRDLSVDELALSLVCRDLRHHRATLALGCLTVLGGNVERGDGLLVVAGDLRVASISATRSWLMGGANQVVESRSASERLLLAADGVGGGEGPYAYNDGMLLESEATNLLLRSSFISGTTGLTLTGSGVSGRLISATAPTEPYFDSSVTPNQLSFDGGTVAAALYATWPVVAMAANQKFCMAVWFDDDASNYLKYQLQRSTDSRYWDNAGGAWVVGSTWNSWDNAFPALQKTIAYYVWGRKTDLLDFGGTGGDLTVRIGEESCVTGVVKNLYHVQLQGESAVVTTPVVTNTATVRRAMSALAITPATEALDSVFVSDDSYTILAELVPLWEPAYVTAGSVKTLLNQEVDGTNRVWIYWDKATASWVFGTSGLSVSVAHNPAINTRVKLACRMADPADGGAAAWTKSIFLNGVLSGTVVLVAAGSNQNTIPKVCYVGRRFNDEAAGTDIHGGIDSIIRRLAIVPYAMTDAEIAAW
jgi:hypothetical protein